MGRLKSFETSISGQNFDLKAKVAIKLSEGLDSRITNRNLLGSKLRPFSRKLSEASSIPEFTLPSKSSPRRLLISDLSHQLRQTLPKLISICFL